MYEAVIVALSRLHKKAELRRTLFLAGVPKEWRAPHKLEELVDLNLFKNNGIVDGVSLNRCPSIVAVT